MNTAQYRLMIYFACATLYFYRTSIVVTHGAQTPEDFARHNQDVLRRVNDEALSLFNYELSSDQMGRAVASFLAPGQSVAHSLPAGL